MVYSLAYRRPAYVAPEIYASRLAEKQAESEKSTEGSVRSGRSGKDAGIPAALAFDKIVEGGTCAVSTRFSAVMFIMKGNFTGYQRIRFVPCHISFIKTVLDLVDARPY